MHHQHILHRDLKTQNIFLTKSLIVKLGDFGISKILTNTTDCAKTMIGTPYYMSPELCEDTPYNTKSDIWSLGCVLYEMTTTNRAFNANNICAVVMKILSGKYPAIPDQYSDGLKRLIGIYIYILFLLFLFLFLIYLFSSFPLLLLAYYI